MKIHRRTAVTAGWMMLSCVLVGGVVTLIATQIFDQRDDAEYLFLENRGGGGPPSPSELRPRYKVSVGSGYKDVNLLLQFTIDDFSSHDGEVRGTVSAEVDTDTYLRQTLGQRPPESIELTMYSLFSTKHVTIPLSSYDPTIGDVNARTVPISLEAWGDSRAFPDDAYAVPYLISAPSGFAYPAVSIITGSRMADYSVHEAVSSNYFNLLIERNALQRTWVYVLVLSPFTLVLAIAWIFVRGHREAPSAALQAAIGIFALLPLRQVLVPADMSSFTRVDLLLGAEFLIFMILASIGQISARKGQSTDKDGGRSSKKPARGSVDLSATNRAGSDRSIIRTSAFAKILLASWFAIYVLRRKD